MTSINWTRIVLIRGGGDCQTVCLIVLADVLLTSPGASRGGRDNSFLPALKGTCISQEKTINQSHKQNLLGPVISLHPLEIS